MGFLSKLFKRKKHQENKADDWNSIVYARNEVDFSDSEQRYGYVKNCLEQMEEAAREINMLTGEYSMVTSYLTDMEEIEALPDNEREELDDIARKLVTLEKERERYRGRKSRMEDAEYHRIRKQENEIQEGITKLKEVEDYGAKIKQDLQRLDRERHAYEYRRQELELILNNQRGMAVIFFTAFAICTIMLMVLQFGFDMNVKAGFLAAAAAVVVAVTVVWVKYMDADRELQRVGNAVNKLILLQNKVKIRYINNRNLTDYLCIKYGVDSGEALEMQWNKFLQEREERKAHADAEAKIEYYQEMLVDKMSNYHIASPERWTGQPAALVDKREMVEIRHGLILRRQNLRKQMDYNEEVSETARREIMDVAGKYPAYADEIMHMVEVYDQNSPY